MPPDLVVDAIVVPSVVTAPCRTLVDVVVRNAGSHPAPYGFTVCLGLATAAEEAPWGWYTQPVGRPGEGSVGLLPNQTATVTFEVTFPCHVKQHWITAEADCKRTTPGNLRSSPSLTLPVSAVPVPWLVTHLRLGLRGSSGVIYWDPAQLCAGLEVLVEVTVNNEGCAASPASKTALTVTSAGSQIASVGWPTPSLGAGGSATFIHILQLPSPPPAGVVIKACADLGGVVSGQCDSSTLCESVVMPVSPGSGSPLLTLNLDTAVVPGETPSVSWSVVNDCSDLGDLTATVLFGPDKLYQSNPQSIAPLGKAGEKHKQLSVPPSAAAALWTIGQHALELHVTSSGAPTTTFKGTGQLQVDPETSRAEWKWPPNSTAPWHQAYLVGGTLTNPSTLTAMTPSAITIEEATAASGVPTAGSMPVSGPFSPIPPGASAPALGAPIFSQVWEWIDPVTFAVSAPLSVTFTYVAIVTVTDELGNVYPPSTSATWTMIVTVSLAKQKLQSSAHINLLTAAACALIAAAIAAADPIAAAFFVGVTFLCWGQAIWYKAQAEDPPVPDFEYHERVQVRQASYAFPREGAPPWGDSIAVVMALLERVRAAHEALVRIHPKILGARVDGEAEALRVQADDYRAALARLEAAAEEVPNAIAVTLVEVGDDEHWSAEWAEAALEGLRSGRTVDAGRDVWRDSELPGEVFDDLLERLPRLEDLLQPLSDLLARVSLHTRALAAALRDEGEEVLAAVDRTLER